MEPVFMVLAQSAATAASQAIDADVAVQDIDYAKLREQLIADKQVLVWTGPKKSPPRPGLEPENLEGIVIDEDDATLRGFSMAGTTVYPYVQRGYRHDGDESKGHQSATFGIEVPRTGKYEVRVGYSAHNNRASNVPVVLQHAGGESRFTVNQQRPAKIDRLFHPLGKFKFEAGSSYKLIISNEGTDGHVIVDAIQVLPQD